MAASLFAGVEARGSIARARPLSSVVMETKAEAHVGPDGELMEVLGLILPDGGGAVALLDDVDLVDDTDPTWRDLVARAVDMDGEG